MWIYIAFVGLIWTSLLKNIGFIKLCRLNYCDHREWNNMSIICMGIAFQFEYCAKSHLQVVLYAWKSNILCIKNTSYDCIQYSRAFIATFRVHSIVSNIKTFRFKIFWLVALYHNADYRYLAKNSSEKEGIENLFVLDSPWLMSLSTNVNTGSLHNHIL